MNKLFLTSVIIFFCCMPVFSENRIPIEITKIYDGDTIEAKIDNNKFKIRLIGIDCYETCKIHRAYKQAYENNLSVEDVIKQGKVSTFYLKNLYEKNKNAPITFVFKGIDKYGRVLGILYIGALNVNDELLKNGGCMLYENVSP